MTSTSIVRVLTPVQMIIAREMSEEDLLTSVIFTAKTFGWTVYHARPARTGKGWRTATQGDNGFPDLCLCRDGQVIFAELKSEKGRVSVEQQNWLDELGGLDPAVPGDSISIHVWRPTDWLAGHIQGVLQ